MFRPPLVGEVVALLKDRTVLYDNGNAVRREVAVDRVSEVHLRGALIRIPKSPFRVADAHPAGTNRCARRAQEESFEAMVR